MYEYNAKLIKVRDGDTAIFEVDLGFRFKFTEPFRFASINTPELHSQDPLVRVKANEAKQYVIDRLGNAKSIILKTIKDSQEKYGRYLAYVMVDGANLNEELVTKGYATPFMVVNP